MKTLIAWIEWITKGLGQLFAWLILPLMLSLCYEVVARYFLRKPTIWAFDICYMLMAGIFFVAASYTLADGRHIRIDFMYVGFSARTKAVVDLIGFILLFLPVITLLAWFGTNKFIESFITVERSELSPWHPIMWPFRGFMALGFILLLLQGIGEILKNIDRIRALSVEQRHG